MAGPLNRTLRLLLATLIAGLSCSEASPRRPIDVPVGPATVQPPRDHDGRLVVRVREGRLHDLRGATVLIEAGAQEFLFHHLADPTLGGGPPASLFLSGRGAANAWLPQHASPPLKPDSFEVWPVDLPAGDYTIRVTLGARDEAVTTLLVR